MRVLLLSHDDVVAALSPAACAEAVAEVLVAQARGQAFMPLRSIMAPPGANGYMGLMPAWRGGSRPAFALKAICLMPGNPARGLDAHQGTVTLFDGDTGMPTAILDASAVTKIRTAAVTAVATDALARRDAAVLGMIGAGVQARAHLEALPRVRDFRQIRIYSPTAAHAQALAGGNAEAAGGGDAEVAGAQVAVRAEVAGSAEEAVRGADVVVVATSSREPVIRREWLGPGTHINAIGASTLNAREVDTATVAACALFADSRESLRHEAGEFQLAIQEGEIAGEDHVRAELGEVLAGIKPGRGDQQELTMFRSLGLAVEDLGAAAHAVRSARDQGLGTEVEL